MDLFWLAAGSVFFVASYGLLSIFETLKGED